MSDHTYRLQRAIKNTRRPPFAYRGEYTPKSTVKIRIICMH